MALDFTNIENEYNRIQDAKTDIVTAMNKLGAGITAGSKVDEISVNVENTIAETVDDGDLSPENIREGVEIFGIRGSYAGVGGGDAIIDITALPTEDINENVFYRLITGSFVYNQYLHDTWICHCVDALPEIGEPAVAGDLSNKDYWIVTVYYNIKEDSVSAYVNEELSGVFGVPASWYPVDILMSAVGETFNGIITDINDDPQDDTWRLLITKDFYIYQDEWCKLPFAYERLPEIDIKWNGQLEDRFVLDVSSLGYDYTSFVKISDIIPTEEQLIGGKYTQSDGNEYEITEDTIDATTFPGSLSIGGVVIVYDQDSLNSALGLPEGYVTNGTYFVYYNENDDAQFFTNHLTSQAKVIKIDSKYLPELGVGKKVVAGKEIVIDGTTFISLGGAEIFNNYSDNKAIGYYSHAEGNETIALGYNTHAEGIRTKAEGDYSHAEGNSTIARGQISHAEGFETRAEGFSAHSEGRNTKAKGNYSHAEGIGTIASSDYSHAQGIYNIEDTTGRYLHIVGNGLSGQRSNAHTIDWDGNAWYQGGLKVGGTGQDDENAKEVATKEYVLEEIAKVPSGGVDLSEYAKTSDVETMIAQAIGSAIGGSY